MPRILNLALILLFSAQANAANPKANASSFHQDDLGKHIADSAFDGLMSEGWGEGEDGFGAGSYLELDLGASTSLTSLSIWPGNLREGKKSYREYSRPKVISIELDGKQFGNTIRILDEMQRLDVPLEGNARKIRINILEAFEGFVYQDMYIAEVGVNFLEDAGKSQALNDWMASPEGQKAKLDHVSQLEQYYERHKTAEFGDSEALGWIMSAVGDGAPYLRQQVVKHVPAGRRAAAVEMDEEAITMLRKLKDPNSIPALEMAELRALGDDKKWLEELVEIFYAHQELVGGPNLNVPYWGETGWGVGAIRSFTEPIPVTVDRHGSAYIADTGNNRVQRFADNGRPDQVLGDQEAGLSNLWFEKGRPWYVSGAKPGTEPGQFFNPLDVEIIPEKETDKLAVLDAKGRIQIFDADGNALIGWELHSKNEVEPNVGGEGYLAWMPSRSTLFAFWGNEIIGFNLVGEEVSRGIIEDGTPNSVIAYKNKFLLGYRGDIVLYDIDGFRYRTVIDMGELDAGYEDVDITLDEEGKIWIVTDTGWVYKFKRPGKLEYKVKVTEYSLEHPRMGVRDSMLYICERDRLLHLDALQLKMDAEEKARKEAENEGL